MAAHSEAAVAMRIQRWPQRFNVVLLLFFSVVILYMDRVNISVVAPVLMQEWGWDPAVMGTVLSAFFLGYFLTQILGGWLSDRWGAKGILGGAVTWWSLVTMLTPFAQTTLKSELGHAPTFSFHSVNRKRTQFAARSCFSEKPYKRRQFSHIIFFLDSRLTPGSSRNSFTPLGNGPSAWG